MATLYIWKKSRKRKSVGHVSLYVHHTKDYISWWSTDSKSNLALKENKVSIEEDLPKTYDEDKDKFMERKADYIYEIEKDCINCEAIIRRRESIINKGTCHLFPKNCATVVMDVLVARALCERYRPKDYGVYTPEDVRKYGKQLHQLQRREKHCFIAEYMVRRYHRRKYNCHCGGLFEQGGCLKNSCTRYEACICVLFFCFVFPFFILYDYFKDMCCSHCNDCRRRNSDLQIV